MLNFIKFGGTRASRQYGETYTSHTFLYFLQEISRTPLQKKNTSTRGAYFAILPASPCAAEFYDIWHTRSTHRHIRRSKFLVYQFRDYGVLTPQNCHLPLTSCVALTTLYALSCYTVIGKWSVLLHVHGHLAEFLLA